MLGLKLNNVNKRGHSQGAEAVPQGVEMINVNPAGVRSIAIDNNEDHPYHSVAQVC